MNPFAEAVAVYEREPCRRTFLEDFEAHLECGYVLSVPEVFVMARPVWTGADMAQILDPWQNQWPTLPNAWWIWLMAGDMAVALRHLPHDLPWIGWERDNVPRFYRLDHVRKKL